jgi:hypothetical protein
LHHLDIGLFSYQLEYSCQLLKYHGGQETINEMDKRLSLIPPFPNLKIFKHGLQNIKRFTASEYRDIMKVSVFVINGILNSVNKKMDIMLTQLYCQWMVMYIMSQNDNHTKISLQEFKVKRWPQPLSKNCMTKNIKLAYF